MDVPSVTENAVVTGSDGGRSTANLNYILCSIGFVTGITALVGLILAHVNRDSATGPCRSHVNRQIRIPWRGVWFGVAIALLYLVSFVAGALTVGFSFILMLIPLALSIWLFVWAIMSIVKEMKARGRREGMPA